MKRFWKTKVFLIMSAVLVCTAGVVAAKGVQAQAIAPESAEKEPLVLSFFPRGAGMVGNYASGIQTDPVAEELARRTGVELDIDLDVNNQEKWMALIASGDLPDLIICGKTDIDVLIRGDHVLALDQLIETHGKGILEDAPGKIEFSRRYYSDGTGKLYFIPGQDRPEATDMGYMGQNIGAWVRWDYYKELGYPEMGDMFDVLDILAEMQTRYPESPNGKKVWALSPWLADWNLWNYTVNSQAWVGGLAEWSGFMQTDLETNEAWSYIFSEVDRSAMWLGAKFYNLAHRMGILDPDSVTQKYSQFVEKMAAERVLFSPTQWATQSFPQDDENLKGFMPIGLPKDLSKYWTLHYPPFGMNDRLFAITTNCKEPERAMEYLAYRHSYEGAMLCYNGVEGKDWVVENGKPKLTEWHLDIYLNDPDWMAVTGAHKYFNHTLRGGGHLHPDYGTPLDLHYAPEVYARLLRSKLHQDYCNHYGVAYPGGAIEHLQHFAQDSTIPSLLPVPTQEIKRLDDRIMTFLKTNLLKLVYTNSDEEFETMRAEMIEELKELGVEESIAYWSKAYANAKKELEELRSL